MTLSHYQWDPEKDLIAEGGFAEVFRAKDLNAEGRYVALKIYKEAVSRGTSGSTGQKKYSLETLQALFNKALTVFCVLMAKQQSI